MPGAVASTSRMWHCGQAEETASRSSEVSQSPARVVGRVVGAAALVVLRKQPFAVVHAGRPYWVRKTARSASAVESPYASTIATVWPAPPPAGRS